MGMGFYLLTGLMIVAALAFILVPLLRPRVSAAGVSAHQADIAIYEQRQAELEQELEAGSLSEDEYRQTRAELDRQLLIDTGDDTAGSSGREAGARSTSGAVLAGLLVPALAVGFYLYVGFGPAPENPTQFTPDDVQAMVVQLETRLEKEPENGEGWLMLGRSRTVMGEPEKAIEALNKARRLLGDTADVLVTYAQALAAGSEDQSLVGMPAALLDQAVNKAPNHPQALWLSGLAAAQARKPEKVLERWSRLQAVLPPDSEDARMLAQNLATLRQSLEPGADSAAGPTAGDGGEAKSTVAADQPQGIRVQISLAPELAARTEPDQTLFVFARATGGPAMPLAVSRHRVAELPLTITLNDSDAMMPGNAISQHEQVEVLARVSISGDARAASGDLEAAAATVKPADNPVVDLVINSIRR